VVRVAPVESARITGAHPTGAKEAGARRILPSTSNLHGAQHGQDHDGAYEETTKDRVGYMIRRHRGKGEK
jgi:hypothetical protein